MRILTEFDHVHELERVWVGDGFGWIRIICCVFDSSVLALYSLTMFSFDWTVISLWGSIKYYYLILSYPLLSISPFLFTYPFLNPPRPPLPPTHPPSLKLLRMKKKSTLATHQNLGGVTAVDRHRLDYQTTNLRVQRREGRGWHILCSCAHNNGRDLVFHPACFTFPTA